MGYVYRVVFGIKKSIGRIKWFIRSGNCHTAKIK